MQEYDERPLAALRVVRRQIEEVVDLRSRRVTVLAYGILPAYLCAGSKGIVPRLDGQTEKQHGQGGDVQQQQAVQSPDMTICLDRGIGLGPRPNSHQGQDG